MELIQEDIIKVLLAILVGGLIGVEREFHDKAAGFRTMILICVGSALFTLFSARLAVNSDPNRIAANIVTGIGFLGAGVILREGGRIVGLTTAATIWLTASIGMGIGSGYYLLAGAVTLIMLIVLWIFPFFENIIDRSRDHKTYEIISSISREKLAGINAVIRECGLKIKSCKILKSTEGIKCCIDVYGRRGSHDRFIDILHSDSEIKEIRY